MRHEKTVSESRFGPLWEPWEVDEIGRKIYPVLFGIILAYLFLSIFSS
ncbi:MAG: hypothetical protein GY702_06990 [Desulfobulbaceae bacterium]|nr:hypothetical protein [Desulfobulbaceae bacterium]